MTTLRYAESAKRVINRAVINEDKNARIIRQLRQEVQELRAELETAKRSPRKRLTSGASVAAEATAAASIAEHGEFQSQLLQELEQLRSLQALSLSSPPPPPVLETETRMGTTTHVHKTLPSLVVNVTKHFRPETALAFTLSEGKTVFGSVVPTFEPEQTQPCDAVNAQESKLRIDTSPENLESSSPPKRGWSPTFLRRRSSSNSAASGAQKSEKPSPTKRRMSKANKSSPANDTLMPAFHHLASAKEGGILARHVQIICTKLPSDDENEPVYCVEVEPLDASARVLLNGTSLPTIGDFYGSSGGTRVEMRHGDQLQLGDAHFFALYGTLRVFILRYYVVVSSWFKHV